MLGVAQFPERVRQLFFPIFDVRFPQFCNGIVGQGDAFWYYSMPLWPQFWMRIIIKQPFSQRTRISTKMLRRWAVVSIFSPLNVGKIPPLFDEHIFFKGLVRFNHQALGCWLVGWLPSCKTWISVLLVSSGSEAARLFLSLLTSCLGWHDMGDEIWKTGWLEWWQGRDAFPKPWILDRIKGELKSGSWRIQKKRAGVQKWYRNIYKKLRPCDQMKQVHSEKK